MTSITSTFSAAGAASSAGLSTISNTQEGGDAFSLALQTAEKVPVATEELAQRYLLPAGAEPDRAHRPNIAEFMQVTGATFETSSSVLYGVIGSNQDLRDWKAIMQSPEPLQAARQAVGAMYNSDRDFVSASTQAHAPEGVVAKSGNVALVQTERQNNWVLVDGQGHMLRQLPADGAQIVQTIEDFGFALKDFAGLADRLDALGVEHGAGTNGIGVELRSLAQGATVLTSQGSEGTSTQSSAESAAATSASAAGLEVALQLSKAWSVYEAAQRQVDEVKRAG